MDFRLTDLQELLRNSAQEFFEREVPSERLREIERAGEPDASLWAQVSELGWLGLPIDEAYGGQGGTLLDTSVLIEEICRAALPCPFVSTVLIRYGHSAVRSGRSQTALATRNRGRHCHRDSSRRGSDRTGRPPTVTFDGRTVSGEKRFVEYGASAAYHLVTAVRDGVAGLALVPTGQSGLAMSPMHTIGTIPQVIADYHDAEVEAWIEGDEASAYLRHLGCRAWRTRVLLLCTEGPGHDCRLRADACAIRTASRCFPGRTEPCCRYGDHCGGISVSHA